MAWTIYALQHFMGTYVGQTKTSLNERLASHRLQARRRNAPIAQAIRAYGWHSFEVGTLAVVDTQEEANQLERYYIEAMNTRQPAGFNVMRGGTERLRGCSHGREGRTYCSECKREKAEKHAAYVKDRYDNDPAYRASVQTSARRRYERAAEEIKAKMRADRVDPAAREAVLVRERRNRASRREREAADPALKEQSLAYHRAYRKRRRQQTAPQPRMQINLMRRLFQDDPSHERSVL